jgi:glycosidase
LQKVRKIIKLKNSYIFLLEFLMKKRFFCIFIVVFIFLNSIAFAGETIVIPSSNIDKWYSSGVFYQLYIRSFKSSKGAKFGDFGGVVEKLDYLKDLGITYLWLLPIHPSSENADGYDIINYMATHPDYGTLDEFKTLLNEAHKRDIRIIIDFVLNHTSINHPFFQEALNNPKSKYRNWYMFRETKPTTGAWAKYWYGYPKQNPTIFYYGKFVDTKPDLNYHNPEVLEYMKSYIKFWLDVGVDGFRLDAMTHIAENETSVDHDPQTFTVLRELRKYIDTNFMERDVFMVGEASDKQVLYFGDADMVQSVFNFKLGQNMIRYVKNSSPYTKGGEDLIEDEVKKYVKELKDKDGTWWGTLLSNHDAYVGIRPFSQLDDDDEKTKLAAALYLTFPGIPFIYYGEEIGMDTINKQKQDKFLRSIMQWDDSEFAGFVTGGTTPYTFLNKNYETYNVKTESADKDSILNYYKGLVNIRTNNKALSLGSYKSLVIPKVKENKYIAALREYNGEQVIVVHNFSEKIANISVETELGDINSFKLIFGDASITFGKKGLLNIKKMGAYKTIILKK